MQARSGGARVKRIKTKVQWTFVPLNGLATDGEPGLASESTESEAQQAR
ncbi:MAG: hypothetical protein V3T69_01930 [Acidiferrobacterales bacterium]